MRVLTILFFFLTTPLYALDLGDESDGVCAWNNTTLGQFPYAVGQHTYNCTSLIISGPVDVDSSVTEPIFIKVQGNVEIDGVFNLAGAGRAPGPGGSSGGLGGANNGADGEFAIGLTTSRGRGGMGSAPLGADNCSGAGGSGGRHSSSEIVNAGSSFDNNSIFCDPEEPSGGNIPMGSYGNPLDFHSVIRGGTGGGAGGGGGDGVTPEDGGNGGGGGGALKIYAGGDLVITSNGEINLSGAAGAGTTSFGGGGGGGAGGAVLLSALGEMELIAGAVIDVSGGIGGIAATGGNGSSGGRGHIRLEDNDGVIPGVDGVSAPGASTGLNPDAANTSPGGGNAGTDLQLQSDLSAGCALREVHHNFLGWPLFVFVLLGLIVIKTEINKASGSRMT